MRLSADNGDMGWDVWVDGVLQKDVVMADDVRGEVEIYVRNDTGFSFTGGHIERETIYGKVEIQRAADYPATGWLTPKVFEPSKVEGLVVPQWGDGGIVPAGEVTYVAYETCGEPIQTRRCEVLEDGCGDVIAWREVPQSDPNTKPAMSALGRVAGEEYRGLGWCDVEGV